VKQKEFNEGVLSEQGAEKSAGCRREEIG